MPQSEEKIKQGPGQAESIPIGTQIEIWELPEASEIVDEASQLYDKFKLRQKQREAIHVLLQISLRQVLNDGALSGIELDKRVPLIHSKEQLEEYHKIIEEMEDEPERKPELLQYKRLRLKLIALRLLRLKNHGTPSQREKAIAALDRLRK